MRHFGYLSRSANCRDFLCETNARSQKLHLKNSWNTAWEPLYICRQQGQDISDLVIEGKYPELCSMVLCLEDAIADSEVEQAERMVIHHLQSIYESLQNGRLSTS